jgi:hypothetical protein
MEEKSKARGNKGDDDDDFDDGRRFQHAWGEHLLPDAAARFDAGRWAPREDALALRAYREACAARGLEGAAALAPVAEAEPFRKGALRAVWLEVAARFERRTVRAVRRRCVRLLHPGARRGAWSAQDRARLAALVAQRGRRWTEIGAIVGRTPHDCASAYEKHGPAAAIPSASSSSSSALTTAAAGAAAAAAAPRAARRSGDWDAAEEAALVRLVRQHSRPLPGGGAADIAWAAVAAGMGGARSVSQCCSKWAHGAARLTGSAGAWDAAADRALVAALARARAASAAEVPWAHLMPGRWAGAECADRFRALCKRLPAGGAGAGAGGADLDFADAVDALAEDLQVAEDDEDDDEDEEEDEDDAAAAAAAAAAEAAERERELKRARKRARREAKAAVAAAEPEPEPEPELPAAGGEEKEEGAGAAAAARKAESKAERRRRKEEARAGAAP